MLAHEFAQLVNSTQQHSRVSFYQFLFNLRQEFELWLDFLIGRSFVCAVEDQQETVDTVDG